MTGGYRRLKGIAGGDKGLEGGNEGIQEVTGSYKGLTGVTRGYRGKQKDTELRGITSTYIVQTLIF